MNPADGEPTAQLLWTDDDQQPQRSRWRSLAGHPPPARVVLADDTMSADTAYRLADSGAGLLWRGDYQNARHLLQALARRVDAHGAPAGAGAGKGRSRSPSSPAPPATLTEAFHAQRRLQALRSRIGGALLLPFDADHGLPLRRAPDVREAGLQAHGPTDGP